MLHKLFGFLTRKKDMPVINLFAYQLAVSKAWITEEQKIEIIG